MLEFVERTLIVSVLKQLGLHIFDVAIKELHGVDFLSDIAHYADRVVFTFNYLQYLDLLGVSSVLSYRYVRAWLLPCCRRVRDIYRSQIHRLTCLEPPNLQIVTLRVRPAQGSSVPCMTMRESLGSPLSSSNLWAICSKLDFCL